jgi:hypothetical protein
VDARAAVLAALRAAPPETLHQVRLAQAAL